VEWVLGGINYSTGDVTFVSQGTIPSVTIKTSNAIAYLDDLYIEGKYNPTGRTLYNLAVDVLEGRDVLYEIDPSLDSIISHAPLPRDTVKNCLQLIANAGMCTLDVNRSGKIIIGKNYSQSLLYDVNDSQIEDVNDSPLYTVETNGQSDFKFDKVNSYNIPVVKKIPPLRNFITSYFNYTVKPTSEELSKIEVSGANNTEYVFDYPISTLVNLTVGAGLSIIGTVDYYAHGCKVTLTGTGTVTITGRKVDVNEVSLTKAVNINGNDCDVVNELLTTSQDAKNFADWMSAVLVLNNEYTIENRGYPELDPMDKIYTDTLYTNNLRTIVTENNITFNGALRAVTKTIIAE